MKFKLLTLFTLGTLPLWAGPAATVTQSVNQVQHGSSEQAAAQSAPVGTQIQDGEYVKTGDASRAELQFVNKTITRLGSNTIFNYNAATNVGDLQQGTLLFSKPKDGKTLIIKTAAVTAAITGTTGFVTPQLFGLIEGTTKVTFDGQTYTITAGEVIVFTHPPQFYKFDVAKFIQTCSLLSPQSSLPTEPLIDQELANYQDLVDRGFILPNQNFIPYPPAGLPGAPGSPGNGVPGVDNALSSLFQQTTPPPPAQPPPYNPPPYNP